MADKKKKQATPKISKNALTVIREVDADIAIYNYIIDCLDDAIEGNTLVDNSNGFFPIVDEKQIKKVKQRIANMRIDLKEKLGSMVDID